MLIELMKDVIEGAIEGAVARGIAKSYGAIESAVVRGVRTAASEVGQEEWSRLRACVAEAEKANGDLRQQLDEDEDELDTAKRELSRSTELNREWKDRALVATKELNQLHVDTEAVFEAARAVCDGSGFVPGLEIALAAWDARSK